MIILRTKLKKNNRSQKLSRKGEWPDLVKIFSFIITLLGILAWISGAAYEAGYWGVPGLDNGLTPKSIQQTALVGFIAAFSVWIKGVGVLILLGFFIALLGISLKKRHIAEKFPKQEKKFLRWLKSKVEYDFAVGQIGLSIVLGAYILAACVLAPMIFWSVSAHSEGKNEFKKQICTLRSNKGPFTEIKTENGVTLKGYVIDRTENEALLLDSKYLHFLKMQDKARLQYSFNLPKIDC